MVTLRKRESRYINEDEIIRIINCQKGERYEKRNIAVVLTGFFSGLRACELRELLLGNIFNENWQLREECYINAEQTKGGYGAGPIYIISDIHKQALIAYINERLEEANTKNKELKLTDPLFVSQKGGKFKSNSLRILIKRIFVKASVTNMAASHSCRRTFATNFSYIYPDPKYLKTVLRQQTGQMAMVYVETNPLILKNVIKKSVDFKKLKKAFGEKNKK